jgi:hypothetical protein
MSSTSTTHVAKELIDTVKQLQSSMEAIKSELGTITLIESRKAKLIASFEEAEVSMKDVRAKIYEQYGDGTIDLNTGEFTPNGVVPEAEIVE